MGSKSREVQSKLRASALAPSFRIRFEVVVDFVDFVAQRALVLPLVEMDGDALKPLADFEPRVGNILADVGYELGPIVSRLPIRN